MSREVQHRIGELNDTQREAIESILQGWDSPTGEFIFPIVEGPPGTGKTTVGVLASARYRLETRRSPQIAYLCYTHYAADRALEGFIKLGFSSVDVLRVVDRGKRLYYQNSPNSRYYVSYGNVKELTPNRKRQLRNVPILITTLHSSGKILTGLQRRPLILIDEFSQVPPTLFFSTLSKNRTPGTPTGYALLGDSNQLPVITSQPFLRPNIGIYISSRKNYEPHELTLQYRMHADICQAVNALRAALHTYELATHESVENRTLTSRNIGYNWNRDACPNEFQDILDPNNPFVIINTDNLKGGEEVSLGGSKYFTAEARLAVNLARTIHDSFITQNGTNLLPTILSPYTAQIGVIQNLLPPSLQSKCITIYRAQGREYPCVIISFARKNPGGWIGFLADPDLRAQTYVACSRAMAKLLVLFSFSTFRGHTDYDLLLERSYNALIIDAEPSWGEKR